MTSNTSPRIPEGSWFESISRSAGGIGKCDLTSDIYGLMEHSFGDVCVCVFLLFCLFACLFFLFCSKRNGLVSHYDVIFFSNSREAWRIRLEHLPDLNLVLVSNCQFQRSKSLLHRLAVV